MEDTKEPVSPGFPPMSRVELPPPLQRSLRAVLRLVSMAEPFAVEFWRSHGLTLMQVRCLRHLRDEPRIAGDLARLLGMSAASMTRLLERLEARELVVRTTDPADRRRVLVKLTETGDRLSDTINFWLHTPAFAALEQLRPEEQDRLSDALERFLAQMDTLLAEDR